MSIPDYHTLMRPLLAFAADRSAKITRGAIAGLALVIYFSLYASPTLANDYEAVIGIGGLVINQSENIAMLSEDLFVSESLIKVRYEFLNKSHNEITTVVTFSLPKSEFDLSTHEDYTIKFSTHVDGETISTDLEKKIVTGTDEDGNAVDKYKLTYYWYQNLDTGPNWSGPIRDFRLIVDKGSPKNPVSFCGSGVRKISATQFEMRKRDFIPKANLEVLILQLDYR
jgi:hypothetical protein